MQQQYLDVHLFTRGLPVLQGITVGRGICLETPRLDQCWMRASRPIQWTPLQISKRALVFIEDQGQAHRKVSYPQRVWHLLLFHPARVQSRKELSPKSNLLSRWIHPPTCLLMFHQNLPECLKTSSLLRTAHLLLPYPARPTPHCQAQQQIPHCQARLHLYPPRKAGFRLFQLYRLRGDQALWDIREVNRIQGVSALLAQWVTAASNRKPQ